jgi:hypothetical protein
MERWKLRTSDECTVYSLDTKGSGEYSVETSYPCGKDGCREIHFLHLPRYLKYDLLNMLDIIFGLPISLG